MFSHSTKNRKGLSYLHNLSGVQRKNCWIAVKTSSVVRASGGLHFGVGVSVNEFGQADLLWFHLWFSKTDLTVGSIFFFFKLFVKEWTLYLKSHTLVTWLLFWNYERSAPREALLLQGGFAQKYIIHLPQHWRWLVCDLTLYLCLPQTRSPPCCPSLF